MFSTDSFTDFKVPVHSGERRHGWRLFSFFIPFLRAGRRGPSLHDEVVRLAETAPHLLGDIGFVVDRGQSNATRTVLRRPGMVIVLSPTHRPTVGMQ